MIKYSFFIFLILIVCLTNTAQGSENLYWSLGARNTYASPGSYSWCTTGGYSCYSTASIISFDFSATEINKRDRFITIVATSGITNRSSILSFVTPSSGTILIGSAYFDLGFFLNFNFGKHFSIYLRPMASFAYYNTCQTTGTYKCGNLGLTTNNIIATGQGGIQIMFSKNFGLDLNYEAPAIVASQTNPSGDWKTESYGARFIFFVK